MPQARYRLVDTQTTDKKDTHKFRRDNLETGR